MPVDLERNAVEPCWKGHDHVVPEESPCIQKNVRYEPGFMTMQTSSSDECAQACLEAKGCSHYSFRSDEDGSECIFAGPEAKAASNNEYDSGLPFCNTEKLSLDEAKEKCASFRACRAVACEGGACRLSFTPLLVEKFGATAYVDVCADQAKGVTAALEYEVLGQIVQTLGIGPARVGFVKVPDPDLDQAESECAAAKFARVCRVSDLSSVSFCTPGLLADGSTGFHIARSARPDAPPR